MFCILRAYISDQPVFSKPKRGIQVFWGSFGVIRKPIIIARRTEVVSDLSGGRGGVQVNSSIAGVKM
jgi:hypothetical protein